MSILPEDPNILIKTLRILQITEKYKKNDTASWTLEQIRDHIFALLVMLWLYVHKLDYVILCKNNYTNGKMVFLDDGKLIKKH